MKLTNLLTRLAFVVFVILFAVAIGLVVLISVTEPSLRLRLDRQGVDTFFGAFDAPMKLFAAGFAVFLAWIALRRMEQTDDQISALTENNRFNNYYKHAQEFHGFMASSPIFEELIKTSQLDSRLYTSELHKYYYSRSYAHFRPQIHEQALNEIRTFFQTISSSQVSSPTCRLINLPLADLVRLSEAVDPKIKELLRPLLDELSPAKQLGSSAKTLSPQTLENFERCGQANMLYWTVTTYQLLLAFDGFDHVSLDAFEKNIGIFNSDFDRYIKSEKA